MRQGDRAATQGNTQSSEPRVLPKLCSKLRPGCCQSSGETDAQGTEMDAQQGAPEGAQEGAQEGAPERAQEGKMR